MSWAKGELESLCIKSPKFFEGLLMLLKEWIWAMNFLTF